MADIIQFPLKTEDSRRKKRLKWRKAGYAVGITLGVIFLPLIWVLVLLGLAFKKEEGGQVEDKVEK